MAAPPQLRVKPDAESALRDEVVYVISGGWHTELGLALLLGHGQILAYLRPLTAQTERILNTSSLALFPGGAALVNAAGGFYPTAGSRVT